MAETGHAKNIENFDEMIAYATSWGGDFNPGNPIIKVAELEANRGESVAAIDTYATAVADLKMAINQRESAFATLPKLVTRVISYYQASGASPNRIADARTFKRKLDGTRKKKLFDDPETPEDETENAISVSQRSYTMMIQHFEGVIELVGSDPLYNPNETALKIADLTAHSTMLKAKNAAVIDKVVAASNARGERDDKMYAEATGLVDRALAVKLYVKAAFGSDSLQYKQIKGLAFRRPSR